MVLQREARGSSSDRVPECLFAATGDDDVTAGLGQGPGGGLPDPAATARDEYFCFLLASVMGFWSL